MDAVVTISRPLARCHHKSGSRGGTAARLKTAAKSSVRRTTVLETRRSHAAITVRRVTAPSRTSFDRTLLPGLSQHPDHEAWQGQHPAPSPGLSAEPVQPFETVLAHPGRRPAGPPRDEIECAAHPQAHDGPRSPPVAVDPPPPARR